MTPAELMDPDERRAVLLQVIETGTIETGQLKALGLPFEAWLRWAQIPEPRATQGARNYAGRLLRELEA